MSRSHSNSMLHCWSAKFDCSWNYSNTDYDLGRASVRKPRCSPCIQLCLPLLEVMPNWHIVSIPEKYFLIKEKQKNVQPKVLQISHFCFHFIHSYDLNHSDMSLRGVRLAGSNSQWLAVVLDFIIAIIIVITIIISVLLLNIRNVIVIKTFIVSSSGRSNNFYFIFVLTLNI